MTPDEHLEHLESDSAAFAAVAGTALDAPVAACPGWDVAALAGHVGTVYGFMTNQLAATAIEPSFGSPQPAPAGAAVIDWFQERRAGVLAALRNTDPAREVWTWTPRRDAGFFFRRMAQETAVHLWDARTAAGRPEPVPAGLAADGIDEILEVGLQFSTRNRTFDYPAGSLHLHQTDGHGEWFVRAVDGSLVVSHEHAKGDAAVRGTASDLLLFLWGRGLGSAEVFGDAAVADAWSHVAP